MKAFNCKVLEPQKSVVMGESAKEVALRYAQRRMRVTGMYQSCVVEVDDYEGNIETFRVHVEREETIVAVPDDIRDIAIESG